MEINFRKRLKNFLSRDLIQKDEGKLTYVQVFGFILITMGVFYLSSFLLPSGINSFLPENFKLDDDPTANGISIAFFTSMLGVAFAFPEMLQGQTKDISTMRITVFMFANVICMLLLKVGWGKDIDSLEDIGLDGYWMGVIAFLFGAKVTQSYFENTRSFFPRHKFSSIKTDLSKAEISRLAVLQNRDVLIARHPNIECVSDTLKDGSSSVTIYVTDNRIETIPNELYATLTNGSVIKVPTEIISDAGVGIPHIGQATDLISDSISMDFLGSICCIVDSKTNPNFKGAVTSGHIFTKGNFFNFGGVLGENQRRDSLINGVPKAKLFFQQMTFNQDIAIVEITDKSHLLDDYISFAKEFYQVSELDFKSTTPNVTITSKENKVRDAYILDSNVSFEIKYRNSPRFVRNIILIGSTNDRATSQTVSTGGDSGSCIYHKESGQLIGMLLGGNEKFSFVLSLEETLNTFNFKMI